MKITLEIEPPTATGQMHKVRVMNGRPVFYDPPEVKEARKNFVDYLSIYKPDKPLDGAVCLIVKWYFKSLSHKDGEAKITRPDTDNLEKLLKDAMTATGYWHDDAQVALERIEKRWSREPRIEIEVCEWKPLSKEDEV